MTAPLMQIESGWAGAGQWVVIGLIAIAVLLTFYAKLIPWWEDRIEAREEERRRQYSRMNYELEVENRRRMIEARGPGRNGNAPQAGRPTTRDTGVTGYEFPFSDKATKAIRRIK